MDEGGREAVDGALGESKERTEGGERIGGLTFLSVTRYGAGKQQPILACRRPGKFHTAPHSQDLAAFPLSQTEKSGSSFSASGVGDSPGWSTASPSGHFHLYTLGTAASNGLLTAVPKVLPRNLAVRHRPLPSYTWYRICISGELSEVSVPYCVRPCMFAACL